jgi:hypothetical protein
VTALLTIFAAGFASVFLLGFQSRNVNHGNYGWAAATSFAVAVVQASIWIRITSPDSGWIEVFVYGLSGMFGITAAMYTHKRFILRL